MRAPTMRRAAAALLGALFSLLPAALPAQEPVAEEAFLLLVGGKRAGSLRQIDRELPDGAFRTEVSVRMTVRRHSQNFTIIQLLTWTEDARLCSVESETDLNGQRESLSARLEGEELRVVQERQGRRSELRIPAVGEVLGPRGLVERVLQAIARSEPELTVHRFLPETVALETVHLTMRGPGELRDSRGSLHRGFLVEEQSSALPGITTRSIYDERGELVYSVTQVGLAMEQVRVDAERGVAGGGEAAWSGSSGEAPVEVGELELFDVASLILPVRWPAGEPPSLGRLTAVSLRFTGTAIPELERAVEAALADLGGRGYLLIRTDEGLALVIERSGTPSSRPAAAAGPGSYTGDGFYLDLSDPRLGALLERCPDRDLGCLEALVYSFIRNKSLQYGFSAVADILGTRGGDCTEHALLLAALLRKAGLASRLAYGFLLTEAGFIGHAWTEVYAGDRWLWLDPSFPGGRPYHFRLRLGVLDPALPVWQQIGVSLFSIAGTVRAELLESIDEQ